MFGIFQKLNSESLNIGLSDFGGSFHASHKMSGSQVDKINSFDRDYFLDPRSNIISIDGVRETSLFQELSGVYIHDHHDHHDGHGQSSLVSGGIFGISFDFGNLLTPFSQRDDDDFESGPETGPRYTSGLGENGPLSDFNVEIKFVGEYRDDIATSFFAAAEYVSQLVIGDLQEVRDGADLIDDVLITARLVNIDGAGGTLGRAGPTLIRTDGGLTATGLMEFDIADVQNALEDGIFDDIALHEMLHVLGFGTLWDQQELTTNSTSSRELFIGSQAVAAYQSEFEMLDAPGVPLESSGGAGTAGSHWEDRIFKNELMTGFIGDETFISATSIASLGDLGYETIWSPDNPSATPPAFDSSMMIA